MTFYTMNCENYWDDHFNIFQSPPDELDDLTVSPVSSTWSQVSSSLSCDTLALTPSTTFPFPLDGLYYDESEPGTLISSSSLFKCTDGTHTPTQDFEAQESDSSSLTFEQPEFSTFQPEPPRTPQQEAAALFERITNQGPSLKGIATEIPLKDVPELAGFRDPQKRRLKVFRHNEVGSRIMFAHGYKTAKTGKPNNTLPRMTSLKRKLQPHHIHNKRFLASENPLVKMIFRDFVPEEAKGNGNVMKQFLSNFTLFEVPP